MKKVIASVIICCLCAGIIYLGIMIFNSKNITKVELVGNVQTLYMVDEKIDYEGAKLKITYRDGEQKLIPVKSSDVKIKNFSTSLEKHGKMQIIYKAHTIKVDYDVLKHGMYYIYNQTTKYSDNSSIGSNVNYNPDTAKEYFYLGKDGVLDYYKKDGSKTIMFDGEYETEYKYYTQGDKLVIKYGNKEYQIFADYHSDGFVEYKSEIVEWDATNEFVTKRETTTFKYTTVRENRTFTKRPEFDLSKTETVSAICEGKNVWKVEFGQGENIETSEKEIYIKIEYNNEPINWLQTVYVHFTDKMVTRESLNTQVVDPTVTTFAYCYYESSEPFYLYYSVVNK